MNDCDLIKRAGTAGTTGTTGTGWSGVTHSGGGLDGTSRIKDREAPIGGSFLPLTGHAGSQFGGDNPSVTAQTARTARAEKGQAPPPGASVVNVWNKNRRMKSNVVFESEHLTG